MNPFTEPTVASAQPLSREAWRTPLLPPDQMTPPCEADVHGPDKPAKMRAVPRSMAVERSKGTQAPRDGRRSGAVGRSALRARAVAGALALAAWLHGPGLPAGGMAMAALAWPAPVMALDLNQATVAQLQGIKGIGPRTAQNIFEERTRGGPYASFEDLSDRVKGIGQKRATALQSAGLRIVEAPPALAPPPAARRTAQPGRPTR